MTTTLKEEIVTLFKNVHGNVNVALPQGPMVAFIDGRFFTTDKKLQGYLQAQADAGEQGVYVDSNEPDIDTQAATPMAQLEKQLRAKILLEMASLGKIDAGVSTGRAETNFAQAIATTESVPGTGPVLMTEEQFRAKFAAELAASKPAPEEPKEVKDPLAEGNTDGDASKTNTTGLENSNTQVTKTPEPSALDKLNMLKASKTS